MGISAIKGNFVMSFIRKKITKEIIRGYFRSGQIGKDIYVTNSLELSDYFSVISSKLIICKQWLNVSHIAIVCRTLGVTVVQIDDIDFPLWENPFVTYDSELKTLSFSDFETIPKTHCDLASKNPMPYHSLLSSIQCQLGIINYLPHIKSVLSNISGQVEQLFLRSELLWLPLRDNPYSFLESHGEDATTNIIFQQLEAICKLLKPRNLNLHFRGLDLRSDEDFNGMQFVQNESNPALGLHGLRQLLTHESYFAAELGAIQRLYASGYHNILYSLPFVTSSDEVNSFVCFMKRHNKVLSQFGAYIETPAAVIDIERILNYGVKRIYWHKRHSNAYPCCRP